MEPIAKVNADAIVQASVLVQDYRALQERYRLVDTNQIGLEYTFDLGGFHSHALLKDLREVHRVRRKALALEVLGDGIARLRDKLTALGVVVDP